MIIAYNFDDVDLNAENVTVNDGNDDVTKIDEILPFVAPYRQCFGRRDGPDSTNAPKRSKQAISKRFTFDGWSSKWSFD